MSLFEDAMKDLKSSLEDQDKKEMQESSEDEDLFKDKFAPGRLMETSTRQKDRWSTLAPDVQKQLASFELEVLNSIPTDLTVLLVWKMSALADSLAVALLYHALN